MDTNFIVDLISYSNGARINFKQCSRSYDADEYIWGELLLRLISKCFLKEECV